MSYRTVAIALTVYGIETRKNKTQRLRIVFCVAIALTVYGIETAKYFIASLRYSLYRCNSTYRLRY